MQRFPGPDIPTKKPTYKAMRRGKKMEMPKDAVVNEAIKQIMHDTWNMKPEDRPHITSVRETVETIAKDYDAIPPDPGTLRSAYSSGVTTRTTIF